MFAYPHFFTYHPNAIEAVPVVDRGFGKVAGGEKLSVLSWNLQFGASRKYHFFYDGGKAVWADPVVVEQTMERIASALKKIDADVVFLQEVDRGADRTGRLDQLQILLSRLDYRWWTGCVYHRARYVPSPWYRPLGKVELWLAILSRAPLKSATRIALPLLAESPLVQRFNLKRALLTAEIPGFTLGCTHLSAFSKGDGTLPRQIACLKDWVLKQENPCILGGDFNALPPGDTPARLPDAEEYADTSPPLAPLLACMDSAIPKLLSPEANTYLPPFKNVPDRVLDYLLVRGCSVEAGKVGEAEKDISDHLPVWAILRKPDRP